MKIIEAVNALFDQFRKENREILIQIEHRYQCELTELQQRLDDLEEEIYPDAPADPLPPDATIEKIATLPLPALVCPNCAIDKGNGLGSVMGIQLYSQVNWIVCSLCGWTIEIDHHNEIVLAVEVKKPQ